MIRILPTSVNVNLLETSVPGATYSTCRPETRGCNILWNLWSPLAVWLTREKDVCQGSPWLFKIATSEEYKPNTTMTKMMQTAWVGTKLGRWTKHWQGLHCQLDCNFKKNHLYETDFKESHLNSATNRHFCLFLHIDSSLSNKVNLMNRNDSFKCWETVYIEILISTTWTYIHVSLKNMFSISLYWFTWINHE